MGNQNDKHTIVTVNGESVYVDSYSGDWSAEILLNEGTNTVTIEATNSLGMVTKETREIEFTAGSPKIQIINCPESTTKPEITIKGRIKGNNEDAMVFINDEEVYLGYDKEFSRNEGENTFNIRAVNNYGKEDSIIKTVVYTPKEDK